MNNRAHALTSIALVLMLVACGRGGGGGGTAASDGGTGASGSGGAAAAASTDTYDVDALGIPKFVLLDYIDLAKIGRISKFRSGIGHDYSDDFESCRSMKHYYMPADGVDWTTVGVYGPATGTVERVFAEWAGYQIHIRSRDYPAFVVILFHVNLQTALNVGDTVAAGQPLGKHIGSQTLSDVAVRVDTPSGMKLVSYLDVLTDAVFREYQSRGLAARADAGITKAARDADPLGCTGEIFGSTGTLDNWVLLGG